MSCSYRTELIKGIKLSRIASKEIKKNTFEIHDKKGNPTGKFETEEEIILHVSNKGSFKLNNKKINMDEFEINSKELYNEIIPIYPMNDSNNLDDFIIGKVIKTINPDYNENLINLDLEEIFNQRLTKEELSKEFIKEFNCFLTIGDINTFILSTVNC